MESFMYAQKQVDELLIIAVMQQKRDMAEVLISQGADVNYVLPSGVTALISAIQVNDMELIRLLLRNKANPRLKVNLLGCGEMDAISFARYSAKNEAIASLLESY